MHVHVSAGGRRPWFGVEGSYGSSTNPVRDGDVICGGPGRDGIYMMYGGIFYMGGGDDLIYSGAGYATVYGGEGEWGPESGASADGSTAVRVMTSSR